MTSSGASFNLVRDPWIPVLRNNGAWERVGMRQALCEAGTIRQIAASNPMDNVALLRFLLAVLMWCKPDIREGDRAGLEGAPGIPGEWLGLLGTLQQPDGAFEMLGEGERFFQHKSDDDKVRPIGDLLIEFPTETKVAHSRHVRDGEYGMCPACCALGIVRYCAFANAYGGGRYTSSVNGPTPAYSIEQGPTLLRTLLLNWQGGPVRSEPTWTRKSPPSLEELDVPTVLAWRSRRLWLGDLDENKGLCAYCGELTRLIRQLAFTGGWKPPFETRGAQKKYWDQDQHLIIVETSRSRGEDCDESLGGGGSRTASGDLKQAVAKTTLGFPSPGANVAGHARFWRRALAAKAEGASAMTAPKSMLVAGPSANKGLYQDSAAIQLSAGDGTAETLKWIEHGMKEVGGVLRGATNNANLSHPERASALNLLAPEFEGRFREQLPTLTEFKDAGAVIGYVQEVIDSSVREVIRSTTPGSALRRLEAEGRAREALDSAVSRVCARMDEAGSKQAPGARARPRRAKTNSPVEGTP